MAASACLSVVPALQANAAGSGVAYVTNQGGGVTVLDTHTLKPIADIVVGRDPRGLAVSPGWSLAAHRQPREFDVSVVDTGTRKEVRRIAIGKNVEFMRISPDGRRAFVTYEPRRTVDCRAGRTKVGRRKTRTGSWRRWLSSTSGSGAWSAASRRLEKPKASNSRPMEGRWWWPTKATIPCLLLDLRL
ncbi:YncE family protein [Cupriavidus basilensis]